jgi:hypothetical protein
MENSKWDDCRGERDSRKANSLPEIGHLFKEAAKLCHAADGVLTIA